MSPDDPSEVSETTTGFERDVLLDKPGVVGARWWHKSLVQQDRAMNRRQVLKTMALVGGAVGAVGLLGYAIASATDDEDEKVAIQTRSGLAMQRLYGWDFGARGEALVFDGASTVPFVRGALTGLAPLMKSKHFGDLQVTTLLEALDAKPTAALPQAPTTQASDTAPFKPLIDVILPIETASMKVAYKAGEALARLSQSVLTRTAILVDLPGWDAVAFAAGAAEVFEPVLLFDNWPHPHGVVASHKTLAALAYYQPRFEKTADSRPAGAALPLFMLDRNRLATYSEASDRFDNRYWAKMPTVAALANRGLSNVLYVALALPEPDDLNEMLAEVGASAIASSPGDARAITTADFSELSGGIPGRAYYGGSFTTDASLWVNYPFVKGFSLPAGATVAEGTSHQYRFLRRASAGTARSTKIGEVAVVVTVSGLIVGAALDRAGSMNRFSGGWGG